MRLADIHLDRLEMKTTHCSGSVPAKKCALWGRCIASVPACAVSPSGVKGGSWSEMVLL